MHSFYRSTEPSGENIVVENQVAALRDAGHEVKLIARSTDEASQEPLYEIKAAFAAAGAFGPSPIPEIEDFGPDVIHVHNLFPNWGTRWASVARAPIIATIHNFRYVCAAASLHRKGDACTECLDRGSRSAIVHACYRESRIATAPLAWASRNGGHKNAVLQNCKKLVCLNDQAVNIFSAVVGQTRVVHIPNFVDPPVITASIDDRNEGDYVYVGRLTHEKGIEWLLNHWPSGRVLTVIGSGPLEEHIKLCARRNNAVRFEGRLGHDETLRRIGKAKAIILPSMWLEGLPTVVLEAYSAGTPAVISNRCGAASELVRGGAGIVFNPDDGSSGLVAALDNIEATVRARSLAARKLYGQEYSKAKWEQRMTSVYLAAIGG